MKRYICFLVVGCFAFLPVKSFSQKVISGHSQAQKVTIKPEYKRELPPNLFVNLSFEDDNRNGILEASEKARLNLSITNKGKGPAQGLKITVKDNITDNDLTIRDGQEIAFIYPDKSATVTVELSAGMWIKSAEHKLQIDVKEHFGYDMDPAILMMSTLQFQEPKLVFSGYEIFDIGEGTSALVEDGKIQAGELVKVKLYVQNIGQNVSPASKYSIVTKDQNVYLTGSVGDLGDIGIGEVKEIWFTLSPNKRISSAGDLPINLAISNTFKRGELKDQKLPLALNSRAPEANIVKVEADIERLKAQVARFEFKSDRITANTARVMDITQAPPSSTKRTDAVGIVIGIEAYDYFAPAPYAASDADVMKNYFRNTLGIEKVYDFTNKKVTGNFFDNNFNPTYGELQKAVKKGETEVFVFYSGHGIPSAAGDRVYLLPSDGRLEAIERQGYDLNTLYNNLEALQAKSVTVFLDACFSGVSRSTETSEARNLIAAKGALVRPVVAQPWLNDPGFTVFSSSDFDQTSLGFDASGTGLFTYFLAAGLQGKADANGDKKITAGELSDYINLNVSETSVKIRGLQSPRFNGNRETVLVRFQ
ncbi:MAG: caspase family protein [Bacteroidales bacterium]|nr:caspase family protein [Bacteroidales bacterium]